MSTRQNTAFNYILKPNYAMTIMKLHYHNHCIIKPN